MSKTFAELGINLQLRESLTKLNILVPNDIQSKTIPVILAPTRELSQQIYSNLTWYSLQKPAIKVSVVSEAKKNESLEKVNF